jgi:signal transduction histidine kinase
MTRTRADNGGVTAEELEALQEEARRILSDLRELAQGIHPSVLTDGGLLEAVEDRCAHLPIEVQLHAAPTLRKRRFPDEIEGAAYFFVTESLANVLKHSGATSVEVSLVREDGQLTLSIEDNGCGFDMAKATHNGLTGLSDRISALGGTVEFDSRPGAGTRMSASLPVS